MFSGFSCLCEGRNIPPIGDKVWQHCQKVVSVWSGAHVYVGT